MCETAKLPAGLQELLTKWQGLKIEPDPDVPGQYKVSVLGRETPGSIELPIVFSSGELTNFEKATARIDSELATLLESTIRARRSRANLTEMTSEEVAKADTERNQNG